MTLNNDEKAILDLFYKVHLETRQGLSLINVIHMVKNIPPNIVVDSLNDLEEKGLIDINNSNFTNPFIRIAEKYLGFENNNTKKELYMTLEQKNEYRFLFLEKLYELSRGSESEFLDYREIRDALKIDDSVASDLLDYLKGEYLIDFKAMGGIIGITHEGIKEYEQAKTNPDIGTEHFPPNVLINVIGSINNSQLLQQTHNSSQVHIEEGSHEEFIEFFAEIESKISDMVELNEVQKEEIKEEIENALALLKNNRKPKKEYIISSQIMEKISIVIEKIKSVL